MLTPKRVKYRKQMRGTMKGNATSGNSISFGEFALQSMEMSWVSSRQIEAARRAISHHTARGGRIWIRIFPDKPITKKPPEVRMGSGKGDVHEYVAVVKPGRILFEIGGIPQALAQEALRRAAYKLPVKTKFIYKGM
ncbi:MAG TPA: 50S ribosomal protein L16 [Candidatus Saccharimonadales bacterium]|nr:50S ribosomal protein L16 [Candidatus Saccharimonadales bacterium]